MIDQEIIDYINEAAPDAEQAGFQQEVLHNGIIHGAELQLDRPLVRLTKGGIQFATLEVPTGEFVIIVPPNEVL